MQLEIGDEVVGLSKDRGVVGIHHLEIVCKFGNIGHALFDGFAVEHPVDVFEQVPCHL